MGTFALAFEVSEAGECTEVNWSTEHFTDDKIVLILEELNNTVWLYYGKRMGLVKRRTALRQAESLRGHGYQVGKTIIGRQLEKIKEIDARMIDRVPEAKQDYDDLLALFDLPFRVVDGECVALNESGGEIKSKPAPAPALAPKPAKVSAPKLAPATAPRPAPKPIAAMPKPAVARAPAPKPEELSAVDEYAGVEEAPPQEEAEEEGFQTAAEAKLQGKESITKEDEIRAGSLIMSLLREFADIYINKKGNHFKIESLEGPICDFTIENGAIKFSKVSFTGMDPMIKKRVQGTFVELLK
ncbi:MAG TPA: hypothetical protein VKM55_10645 [Candidatus Lokiarchaeia archaeon]|nr:hypothetical protein [Candidatus Lokiarchaeia archaeon]